MSSSPVPSPATPLLTATGLRKCYGGRAVVDGVSLSVSPGEMVRTAPARPRRST